MKVKALLYASLAGISLLSSQPVKAEPTGQAVFQKLYDKADVAAAKKDADGAISNYSTTVVAVQKDGTTKTYQDLLSAAQQAFTMASAIASHTNIVSCKVNGGAATVVQDGVTKISIPNPTGGPPMVIEDNVRARDEWKKGDSGWKIVKEVVISDDMKANGRPVGDILGGAGSSLPSPSAPDEPSE